MPFITYRLISRDGETKKGCRYEKYVLKIKQ